MKNHTKHIYKKISTEIKGEPNMFQSLTEKNLGEIKTKIITFKCKCGDIQQFHLQPEEKDSFPNTLIMNVLNLKK